MTPTIGSPGDLVRAAQFLARVSKIGITPVEFRCLALCEALRHDGASAASRAAIADFVNDLARVLTLRGDATDEDLGTAEYLRGVAMSLVSFSRSRRRQEAYTQ